MKHTPALSLVDRLADLTDQIAELESEVNDIKTYLVDNYCGKTIYGFRYKAKITELEDGYTKLTLYEADRTIN